MKISRILAASALAACLIATTAFASGLSVQNNGTKGEKSTVAKNSKNFTGGRGMHGGMDRGGFEGNRVNPMDSLVTAGTITQVQADAIHEAMKTARDSNKTMKETLDSLVTVGTITQAQEDAIVKTMPEKGGFKGNRVNPMDSLVTAGTITQVQADAIHEAMKTARDSNKTMKETLDSLVTAGTITQAQEDAIKKAIMPNMKTEK